MLAALHPGAIILGVASGGLAASLVALLLAGGFTLLGAEWGADVGLLVGVIFGLAFGGWLAGLKAPHSERFHGSVTGLILAFLIMVTARLGGSPAGTWTILWLALLSIVISGAAGWLAGRKASSS